MSRVVIVGAGIVGVSTALWLQRDGHEVTVIDRGAPGDGTSYGNAGVLASCSIVPVTGPGLVKKAPGMLLDRNQPLFLKWGYLPKLMPWLRKYLAHANAEDARRIANGLAQIVPDSVNEHMEIARGTPAERFIAMSDYNFGYRDLAHFKGDAFGWSIRRDHGMSWDVLEGQWVRKYDPALGEAIGCLVRVGNHGHIKDPGAYVKALAAEAEARGARFIRGEATDVLRENGAVTGVRVGGETVPCDKFVLATGVWSGPLAKALGIDVPLETERGYHIELIEPSVMPSAPLMVASGKFVATPMEGRLRCAGIVEFGGLDAAPSRRPFQLLEEQVKKALPGLTFKDKREWMGHRPATADSLPLIGEVDGIKGAFLGFGHHHIGLTSGPKTGRLLAQLIAGRAPNIDISMFAPSRFASRPAK
ncbi:FAD-binding oxidoreductase [Acuticoccus sp. MNP-M23]|uniref:NAD(P)/FAD-dependent oxidoreductase n=1 Tax=Acuticoccus sp. MNP-M23 TaxID=3072793 RepID=UPI0028162EDE|nr:FAD-binding oxidoreductase [Acuticoccus sp. MNP-M23]WMS42400.1 FAD-binding oxidoreductase [Acuticoccus sp. MNP-M23]